ETVRYSGYSPSTSPDRQHLSKLVNIEGRYYKITATASGDKVTVEPAELPLAAVVNSNGPYRAVIFGEHGLIKISGEADKPVAVPAGEWRVLEYQIDLTNVVAKPASQPEDSPAKPAPGKKSLGQRLAGIFGVD